MNSELVTVFKSFLVIEAYSATNNVNVLPFPLPAIKRTNARQKLASNQPLKPEIKYSVLNWYIFKIYLHLGNFSISARDGLVQEATEEHGMLIFIHRLKMRYARTLHPWVAAALL